MLRKPALCLNDLAQGGGFSASSASKYVAFTPRRRQDGGPHCLGGDLSGSFASMQRCRLGSDHGRRRKPVAKLKEFVFRDHRRFPRDVSLEARLGRAAHLAAHAAAHDAPARPWDIVQRDTRCKQGLLHRSGVPRTAARRRGECAKTARRLHDAAAEIAPSNPCRPAISTTPRQPDKPRYGCLNIRSSIQSCTTSLARARSFSVSLFNCPQAANISRPRGVRTGLA